MRKSKQKVKVSRHPSGCLESTRKASKNPPVRPPNEITAARAAEYGLPAQSEGETDGDFRRRVAGTIREQHPEAVVEAHEALSNRLYNDRSEDGNPFSDPMMGIIGDIAAALCGSKVLDGLDGPHRVETEGILGTVISNSRRRP